MEAVAFDVEADLLDEAPDAYKDIRTVMRAQRELTKPTRTLRPLLSFKGASQRPVIHESEAKKN